MIKSYIEILAIAFLLGVAHIANGIAYLLPVAGTICIVALILLLISYIISSISIGLWQKTEAQIGPTCGFYTLNNALRYSGEEYLSQEKMESIIRTCHENGDTVVGEVFDIDVLSTIGNAHMKSDTFCVCSYDGTKSLITAIKENGLMIVPILRSRYPHWILVRSLDGKLQYLDPNTCATKWKKVSDKRLEKWLLKLYRYETKEETFDWNKYLKHYKRVTKPLSFLTRKIACSKKNSVAANYALIDEMHKKLEETKPVTKLKFDTKGIVIKK